MAGKKLPSAFAVIEVPKASKLAAAEGKLAIMQKIRERTDDGEKLISFLMNVITGGGTVGQGLTAAQMLFDYGYGKPIEVKVTADATPQHVPAPGVNTLTSAQLEAVITGSFRGDTDLETTPSSVYEVPTQSDAVESIAVPDTQKSE